MKKEVFPIEFVITALEQEVVDYAVPVVDLIAAQTKDPLKVLLATILSARTKDEVTAAAAKRLFAKADSLEALERLSLEELEKIIYLLVFFGIRPNILPTYLRS
ncbi:HhH-GPD superfamily base excision DNA repair protein [Candidatus Electrothrix communis]|uniref:HhH-GPD superfamily base excision DNA repair protein n=1 Tax=Candidatus Electrothrix communis TaxID=1859133 RepID=A0A444J9W8_9BACT|nr:HhH-GPD superfamily base excision DNA repair protein [Candidatus Electrothrix communis]